MKAILVIDMPECCCACDYCNSFGMCKYAGNVEDAFYRGLRYIKCPLKPIPQKKELEESGNSLIDDCKEYYIDGWNDCLDEILGEEE